jgi:uncharacterized protein (DUF2141 family)
MGFCLAFYSCATPTSPTGGPPDKTGPKITSTQPKTGTVNFKGHKITLHFSEYVTRNSLSQALQIEPETGIKHSLDWGKKKVTINFKRAFPDSTTLIVTIGTKFSDLHGNTMDKPYQVAVSTGPEIDKGKLVGRVLDARTGKGTKGKTVLLYRKPIDLKKPANYIAETDTGGVVHFSYLSPGTYKAFWVDDRNRDKIWEPKQERAQPFQKEFVTLKKANRDTLSVPDSLAIQDTLTNHDSLAKQHSLTNQGTASNQDSLGTLYIANSDTTKPQLQGVGLFSSQRLRLRFSENIDLTDSTRFSLRDSTTQKKYAGVYPLYVMPKTAYVLFAHSMKPLSPDTTYSLTVLNIANEAGNVQPQTIAYFTGSSQKDTTKQRVVGISVGKGIFPQQPISVAYAAPITKKPIKDSIKVTVGDSVYTHWKGLAIHENKLRLFPDGAWKEDTNYQFHVWNPISKSRRTIKPTIWHKSDLGSLEISFSDSTGKAARQKTMLQLKNGLGKTAADTSFTGKITLNNLAPIKYQLILYQDLNGNGKWDPGTVSPFKPPEPYYIRNNISIQKGLTATLKVRFKGYKSITNNISSQKTHKHKK